MGVMRILDTTGHTDVEWSLDDLESLAAAEAEFTQLRKKGYEPFEYIHGDEPCLGRRLKTFEAQIEEMYWVRPLVGG